VAVAVLPAAALVALVVLTAVVEVVAVRQRMARTPVQGVRVHQGVLL
jgi:hypothetical protein